jgi:hypothetical protein
MFDNSNYLLPGCTGLRAGGIPRRTILDYNIRGVMPEGIMPKFNNTKVQRVYTWQEDKNIMVDKGDRRIGPFLEVI